MAHFSGPQHRGAGHERDRERRLEAEFRDDVAVPERCQPNPSEPERDCE